MKQYILALALGLSANATFADTTQLSQSIEGKHRTEANVLRDVYRNPVKTLDFFGVKPHHTVVEIWPGGGWYTEILAPYLKKDGKLIAAHYDEKDTQASYRASSRQGFDKKIASHKVYNKVETQSLVFDETNKTLKQGVARSNSVDRVVTFRAMHGMYSRGITDAAFAHYFDILKPGGKLGLVQHKADAHQDWQSKNIGYVGQQYIIDAAHKAGFVLEAQAYFNGNSRDTKHYDGGVWRLPPSLKGHTNEEKKAYQAIGESDRMTLLFIKPKL